MEGKLVVFVLAASLATAAVVWWLPAKTVQATGGTNSALCDTDGDFLPDSVEWVVLTSASNPDTDGDQIPDFVEVVEGGNPRHENMPLPMDQQMRVVVTGPAPGGGDPLAWMHIFLRVIGPENAVPGTPGGIQAFNTWIEMGSAPGVQFPLNSFAASGLVYQQRVTQNHGIWLQLSVPMVSVAVLRSLSPCTIWAESTVADHQLVSGVKLIDVHGDLATLVPYGDGRFVMQTISPMMSGGTGGGLSNRVCVLQLKEIGSGPGGTMYQVTGADCEDANELECSSTCLGSVGWVLTIPGGTGLLGGN